jgi:hypothetical protein
LYRRGGGGGRSGVRPLPLTTTLFPSWSVDISFKDDVTVILHCFYCITSVKQIPESIMGGIISTERTG